MRFFIVPLIASLSVGCMTLGPSPDQLKAITSSPNTKCLRVSSVYGTLTYYDSGSMLPNDLICGPDGFMSKTPATTMGIPLTITPQFTIQGGTK